MSTTRSILITQCVQNDFVRPLSHGEPLPNLVHVGALEAERLAGPTGALPAFLQAAHGIAGDRLAIVHVMDQHDAARDAEHFRLFRPHCVAGTAGAELIDPIPSMAAARTGTQIVAAADLNDFEDSALPQVLAALTSDPSTRIGVIGVWTDAKVAMLLYDLATRMKARSLATCSALTASRSLSSHFEGLERIASHLGVEVFHSPASFLRWLVPCGADAPRSDDRERLVGAVTGGADVALTPLAGGFSGAQVLLLRAPGREARIVKIGARDEIARERFGNERIRRILGDTVPRLHAYHEGSSLAAMEVALADSGDAAVEPPATFKKRYEADDGDVETRLLERALVAVLDQRLGRLYRAAEKDNADLLTVYGFTDNLSRPMFADSVAAKADGIATAAGFSGADELLSSAGLPEPWMAPRRFYQGWLPSREMPREVAMGLVHGDLNLANILLSRNAASGDLAALWVIDFARLARMPVLTDFAKIENDLAYILQPLPDPSALDRAAVLQDRRLSSETLLVEGLPDLAADAGARRHAILVRALRRVAATLDPRGAEAMRDYRIALLRFAAHTLGFDEPSLMQRRLALLACARLAGLIASVA
ncbi:MAG: hypothetical protein U0166_09180 [Acidobacteriota bacterium]